MTNHDRGCVPVERLGSTVRQNWHMGFTSFGGPPVHFKIFYDKFTVKLQWLDEQVYQELFSVCQALSGPASTKMHYCINLIHDGFWSAILGFFIWSLPGAIGMYALSIGVSNIGESLPRQVYALLSGLNAATVGIIVLAAVQLSQKAITDRMTRVVVFLSASAGMLYNALWYFPVLMVLCGVATVVHDYRWLHGPVEKIVSMVKRQRRREEEAAIEMPNSESVRVDQATSTEAGGPAASRRSNTSARDQDRTPQEASMLSTAEEPRVIPQGRILNMSWKLGLFIIGLFFTSFIVVMVLRGTIPDMPLLYSLFANMYLAGTIIFGGGPVVIPLLREYVVAEGWVSPRDFLIGLALIQAFPGPNFNFAVYLGSLTAINGGYSSVAGALIGFVGIFFPGLVLVHGTMGLWSTIRHWRWVKAAVRGVNAAAVGLIYTAVYRLWQIGYIDEGYRSGTSLAVEPWWVVTTATSFFGSMWLGVSPPVAIVTGGAMGMVWYGVVTS
ncbi:chromate transporter-domain-containing protein [Fusarium solani]|uniref:Chromate transporter-domain-containing protein n=1 Tax=Fusarium solani TaxID=169388 RepID=A0A9P9L321_FUSSL|nr:chromate transporter-domain-containing protein [Fusarium solani]KAH7273328.1 chromate transporter-domain-containing protein [Fusarium solani]